MAEELDPIRQNIEINVTDKGADEATSDLAKLNTTITASTTATEKNTKEVKKSEDQFKSYKQQLKEATIAQQKLAQQYGATSTQAIDAAKKVATITDEMQFQKDLAKSYNPDEKFRALSQTAGLATLALGGVKDGLAALGIENKTLDKIIGSAQAILGVTSAVSGITDAYQLLTAAKKAKTAAEVVEIGTTEALTVVEGEATVATWSFNAALLANPIVAITAGIVAAVAILYTYIKITGDAAKEEERLKVASLQLSVAIDQQAKSFENNSKFISAQNAHKIALLKASGASEAQIYKETKALANQELQLAKNYRTEAAILEQRAYEANRDNPTEFTEKTLANAQENLEKAKQLVSAGYDGLIKLQQDHEVAKVQAQTDADNEARKKAQQQHDTLLQQQKDANKKRLEEEAAFRLKMIELADANETAEIEKRIANTEAQSEQIAKEEEDRTNAEIKKQADNDAYFALEAEKSIARDKDIADAKLAQKQAESDALNSLGNAAVNAAQDLFGKNKKVQKGIIVADGATALGKVAVNTIEAVSEDNAASPLTFGMPWSGVHIATGALGAASIISNTQKALQAVGGGSAPSASAGGVPTPSRNVAQVGFQGSSENQISSAIAKQQKDMPPLQAFVVSQSVTDQQELDRKKELNNSF